ncbi:unnamed protein product [Microthlaspi erraticum]|uniref:FBD domain-containing protein n=1 Tax=Microthlaspi erraticum TaxID=1685480 RepID=A0A6D2LD38_9BRAS|nr:unnamed protein product [Microthlaspi erraticum]
MLKPNPSNKKLTLPPPTTPLQLTIVERETSKVFQAFVSGFWLSFLEICYMDRISLLPDELLLRILSLLPTTKDVVATMVLSQRWLPLWKLTPKLVYDDSYQNIEYGKFSRFVDRSLILHEAPLDTLHFKLVQNSSAADVGIWTAIAVKRCVRELISNLLPVQLQSRFQGACTQGPVLVSLIVSREAYELYYFSQGGVSYCLPQSCTFKAMHMSGRVVESTSVYAQSAINLALPSHVLVGKNQVRSLGVFHRVLETLIWANYEGREEEKQVAAFILRSAKFLKKATISSKATDPNEKLEMIKELSSSPRRSPTCQLIFV